MFGLFNQMNVSVQRHNLSIIDAYDKIKSFQVKVDLRLSKLKGRKTYVIQILAACLEESNSDSNLNAGILSEIEAHLLSMEEVFSRHFPDIASNLFPLVKFPSYLMLLEYHKLHNNNNLIK
jgi:hypothetical protein